MGHGAMGPLASPGPMAHGPMGHGAMGPLAFEPPSCYPVLWAPRAHGPGAHGQWGPSLALQNELTVRSIFGPSMPLVPDIFATL